MMTLLMIASTTMTIMLLQLSSPLSIGLLLLMQTTLISTISGMMMKTFWFSYILFLIFMGGMLVLFIYVASLSPNEPFTITPNVPVMITALITSMMILIMTQKFSGTEINMQMMEAITQSEANNMISSMTKIYSSSITEITLLLINYLLLSLIAVVKITNLFFGPIRMKT
uniref:NADH-ubiquinone oxidoreductase chain 6 n=1 Tax=Parajapyx emeryanus TaxID=165473 RepID=U3KTI1_9HEXA|nr:NADH dehydrogenase subunit 6 [Parajapyx emeryanus]AEV44857.1 NADH dehydrogenase subunit 6 [Parajapyx emeryanus]